MLLPIAYVPEVKPKKIEPRKSRIQMRASGAIEDADEAEGTFEPSGPGQTTLIGQKSPLDHFVPIEGAERKPQQPQGRLSESTLKVMLQAQELT
jgi:hypothetical protein